MPQIDAKNDRFGLPKASQNDSQIGPQNDKNRCQKRSEKRTNMRRTYCSEMQTSLTNLRKIHEQQKSHIHILIRFWLQKRIKAPNRTPKQPQKEQKNNTKRAQKKKQKKRPAWLQNDLKMPPQNDTTTIKNQDEKRTKKNEKKLRRGFQMTPKYPRPRPTAKTT